MLPIVNKWTCLDQAGVGVGWVWLGASHVYSGKALPGDARALEQFNLSSHKVWVWVWLEASCFLEMEPWLDAANPEQR